MIYNDFKPNEKVSVIACDTETYTYIDGVKVSTSELEQLGAKYETAWFRKHASIEVYAWLVSDGLHFAFLETFTEWCEFCCEHNVKTIWWYNAKFDFAQIDYQMLSGENGVIWKIYDEDNAKQEGCTFSSLHSDRGQRYSLKMWYKYKGHGRGANRREHVHAWTNYDFCNIFGGGLARNLNDFNVVDFNGQPIRKLDMDYQDNKDADGNYTKQAIEYMKIDVYGLYHLVRIADEYTRTNYSIRLLDAKPNVMTAGGFAKRILLEYLFKSKNYKRNKQQYRALACINIESDALYRDRYLYEGGICIVNSVYQNRLVKKKFYRYDINSMYPDKMYNMPMIVGKPSIMTYNQFKRINKDDLNDKVVIYTIDSLDAVKKPSMLAILRDYKHNKAFSDMVHFETDDNINKMWFDFELNELEKWYDMDYHIKEVYVFNTINAIGFKNFVDDFYKQKNEAKKTGNLCMKQFSKLMLNSSYGKLAERCVRVKCHRELNAETGAIHLVEDGEEIDFKSLLSVVQGAYITAKARVQLLSLIRYACPVPERDFIYCDTDSIHIFTTYDKADNYKLGELKLEDTCIVGKWLAPKTYFEVNENYEIELHTKGIPISKVIDEMTTQDALNNTRVIDIDKVNNLFADGQQYQCLCGMNIKGGKALIPLFKELCKSSNTIKYNSDAVEELLELET